MAMKRKKAEFHRTFADTGAVWDQRVPFDEAGNLIYRPSGYEGTIHWVKNHVFAASLLWRGFRRAGASVYAVWLVFGKGVELPMFVADLGELLGSRDVKLFGRTQGNWTFRKVAGNFGLRMAEP